MEAEAAQQVDRVGVVRLRRARPEVGQTSSAMRLSRTYEAKWPSVAVPSSWTVISSVMRTPRPTGSAPQTCTASWIDSAPTRLTGVDGGVVAAEALERGEVPGRRVADLAARDAALAVLDGQQGLAEAP